jgi:hypothetical protein
MAKVENPFAFPWRCDENTISGDSGMTLRDWFAGQALSWPNNGSLCPEDAATFAYDYADAMLRARQATPNA